MATTTNYSWTTPDDTALVKDGAAAIRTLGSSVDTTVKNLNPETTLGDIAYRSSTANVKTRLGLGTAGQVLAVNSGANAPEWVTPAAGGSYTLLSTTSITGATTTVSSINQTYQDLFIEVYGTTFSSTDTQPEFQINSTGTSRVRHINDTLTSQSSSTLNIYNNANSKSTSANNYFGLQIRAYATTDRYKSLIATGSITDSSSVAQQFGWIGAYTDNSAITEVSVKIGGGRTYSTGTIKVWGIK
jgi:hypothetical protein